MTKYFKNKEGSVEPAVSTNTTNEQLSSDQFLNKVNNNQKKLGHNKMQIEIDVLKDEILNKNSVIEEQNEKIVKYKERIEELINHIKYLNSENEILKQDDGLVKQMEINNNLTVTVANVENDLNNSKYVFEHLKNEYMKLQDTMFNYEKEIDNMKKTNDDLHKENIDIKKLYDENILLTESLRNDITKLKQENDMINSTYKNSEDEKIALKNELVEYKKNEEPRIQELEEQIQQLRLQLPAETPVAQPKFVNQRPKRTRR